MRSFTESQKEYIRSRKVVFCTPFYMSSGFSTFFCCLLNTIRALDKIGVECDFMAINGSSYVDHARNVAVNKFLKEYPDYTDLFFIDSDMEWDIDGILRVLAAPYDFVGAAYPMKNNWENFSVRHDVNVDLTPKSTPDGYIISTLVPGGFMRLSRNCLEKMIRHYPETRYANFKNPEEPYYSLFECVVKKHFDKNTNECMPVRYGEDSEFCTKWLAIGGTIVCEPDITFGHHGVKGWYGNYHEFLCRQPRPGTKNGSTDSTADSK